MSRRILLVLTIAALSQAGPMDGQPYGAEDCYVGPGLGATLLIPYFEVDLENTLGVTTLLAINNGLNDAAMTRVVFWTDWGVPTLAFDIYLDGFDEETLNVGSVLGGDIPPTGEGVDLSGLLNCDEVPPFHSNPVLTANEVAQLAADHTGQPGPLAFDCAGSPTDDGIARGYITVDVVDECNGVEGFSPSVTPSNTGRPYFAEGGGSGGVAIASNRLWGDVIYVSFLDNSAQGSEAVPIWANPDKFTDTDIFTFYGGYSGWDGRDERVPLPSIWDQRFLNGGPFAGGADLIVWRSTGATWDTAICGGTPSEFPLRSTTEVFDLAGDGVLLADADDFPWASQRVSVDSLGVPFDFGWVQLLFTPAFDPSVELGQAWVQPSLNARSLFSANLNGTPVDFLCTRTPPTRAAEAPAAKARPSRSSTSAVAPQPAGSAYRSLRPGVQRSPR